MVKAPRKHKAFRRKTEDNILITKTLRCIDAENVVRDRKYEGEVKYKIKKKVLYTNGNIYIASAKGVDTWEIENDRDGTQTISAETLAQCFVEVDE
jgi:hypothetical protein